MINRCRLGPRQKTEECNTSRVGISLAKTEKDTHLLNWYAIVLGRINVESIAQLATSICKDKGSRSRRSYKEK